MICNHSSSGMWSEMVNRSTCIFASDYCFKSDNIMGKDLPRGLPPGEVPLWNLWGGELLQGRSPHVMKAQAAALKSMNNVTKLNWNSSLVLRVVTKRSSQSLLNVHKLKSRCGSLAAQNVNWLLQTVVLGVNIFIRVITGTERQEEMIRKMPQECTDLLQTELISPIQVHSPLAVSPLSSLSPLPKK